ncbi:sigma-Y antisigma factor component [Paenibacillus solisilvae]|uniref:Sigma-Y antisigma factor component n=1 Tax=Paenibacillus solisilvae TaxID=2486751 RepID=A0ABW0VV94_9BACL
MDKLTLSIIWILVGIVLICQSSWLFLNASKHSPRYRWFWGVWGMIQFPLPLLFYWLFVRMDWSQKRSKPEA